MSKYRLSYVKYGRYFNVNLQGLEFFKNKKYTDIDVIDEFTTNFNNLNELIEYLKNSELIDDDCNKLFITIDKKENNFIRQKKIYNGDKLLFKNDKEYLKISYIYKWIMINKDNYDYMITIANNYLEKYKNAYNRITGSSNHLALFYSLKNLARVLKANNSLESSEVFKEFEECVEDFINIEFYKIDKDIYTKERRIEIKKDSNGIRQKSYRNIHDFVLLMKEIDISLGNNPQTYFEEEEFLTKEDFRRSDTEILDNYHNEKFDSYVDGNDFIKCPNKTEIKNAFKAISKKLILPKGDGDK